VDSTPIEDALPRKSRKALFAACFAIGMLIAAGIMWKMGRLGGSDGDDERFVTRATDAMYKNRFAAPPGDNVRDITDEGLKRWPNDHRLLDVRMRAANELRSQAMVQRTAGDVVEALRLARTAQELDPNDASAKRLVEQYEAELAGMTTPPSTPLAKPSAPLANPSAPLPTGKTSGALPILAPSASGASSAPSFKIVLEASAAQPRLGQTVEFTARVAPPKGAFEGASFSIVGPGLGTGVTMPAQSPVPGVFKASFAFLEAGRFDVTVSALADGKPLRAGRSLVTGETPRPADPKPPAAPSSSVKWM
jgi:serine/threonine-protein kinase